MPAEIHLVEISSDLHKHEQEMQTAKLLLRNWATKYLGWKDPKMDIKSGIWGTKQVIIPEAGFLALLRDRERRLALIRANLGCEVHFSSDRDDGMRIVSIVGAKDRLDVAATKVLYTW